MMNGKLTTMIPQPYLNLITAGDYFPGGRWKLGGGPLDYK